MPRLEIDLNKLHYNTRTLVDRMEPKGINVTGVTKVALGCPEIAQAMLRGGVESIGDSRIENIQKMREAGIAAKFILLRTPLISQTEQVVLHADISFNSELSVIESLNQVAKRFKTKHQVALMIELGDLREGILPRDLESIVRNILQFPAIQLVGLGANLACFGGVKPDDEKMTQLSNLAQGIEQKFDLKLDWISGGNSANLQWLSKCSDVGAINNLRLGESIFLGCDPLNRQPVEGLHLDALTLVAEVIESKVKPSLPFGGQCQTALGTRPILEDRGQTRRAILGIGRQDVDIFGLTPLTKGLDILGGSSDHLMIDCHRNPLLVGEEVRFQMDYSALLAAMTSPYIQKVFLKSSQRDERHYETPSGYLHAGMNEVQVAL